VRRFLQFLQERQSMKLLFVFGTRPEAIKMAPVIKEAKKAANDFEVIVVAAAQHREMLDQVLKIFCIKADYDLNIMTNNQSLFDVTSKCLSGVKEVLEREKPDLVLIQGDTTTAFTTALAAFYLRIKVGHIEAGLRTFDIYRPFPEEMNRRLISSLATLHFAPTEKNRENLIREGIDKNRIFVTGNTVIDALLMTVKNSCDLSNDNRFRKIDFDKKMILVTAHRRENFGENIRNICYALKVIAGRNKDIEIIYPVHPNPNIKNAVNKILGNCMRVHLIKPLGYYDFVQLMNQSYLILTDSGGIQEEAPSLGKPVLVLREKTERPEAIETGTVKVIGTDKDCIVYETNVLLDDQNEYDKMAKATNPYGDGKASERIVRGIYDYYGAKCQDNQDNKVKEPGCYGVS